MEYSTVGILAAIVHVIINHDVFRSGGRADRDLAHKAYRRFLFGILTYFVTDAFWGIFDALGMSLPLYADTVVYFAVMAISVMLWSSYVIAYLGHRDAFAMFLAYAGITFVVLELVVLAVNFVHPVLFWLDGSGEYHAGLLRYVTLLVQIVLFLLTSAYTLSAALKAHGAQRRRYLTISAFGLAMIVAITVQVFFPLMPYYSMGYLLGSCVLHAFVIEGEKEEHRQTLEELLQREKQQRRELGSAKRLAYTDPLTKVKNSLSYMEATELLDEAVEAGTSEDFALVVLDINDLKLTNDTLGHDAGDELIVSACRLVCEQFRHSPVFRIGGDEFAVILKGADYEGREALLASFDEKIDENRRTGGTVVAAGMAEFDPARDDGSASVFKRADERMYARKQALKAAAGPS